MDENYLDNLLNEFSLDKEIDNDIEEELDEQIRKEKDDYLSGQSVSREEAFDLDLENDAIGGNQDVDIDFSEDQIDELDRLDNFADLDMGDLDFDDLDFDDLDITKLNDVDIDIDKDFDEILKDFDGDLEIPSFSQDEQETSEEAETSGDDFDALFDDGLGMGENNSSKSDSNEEVSDEEDVPLNDSESDVEDQSEQESVDDGDSTDKDLGVTDDLNEDNFDADSFLDSLLNDNPQEDVKSDNDTESAEDEKSSDDANSDNSNKEEDSTSSTDSDDSDSLDDLLGDDDNSDSGLDESSESSEASGEDDDLFAMLGLEENGGEPSKEDTESATDGEVPVPELDTSALEGLDDIEDISEKPKKKKRSFMEILFGPPDEDDEPTEEELKAIEEKKAAKKAKKEADAEKKKAKAEKDKADKSKKDADKKRADAEKARVKAEKKAKKKAAAQAEAANAEPEKKLNKPMVIFIFSVFLGGVGFLYLSSVDFNYRLAIQHAANYFASQKYHKAYDEIKGVDVKEKDQELKERIYTVMYVERLYEGYENNIELGRQKKALDSLLRGVAKYYEYYDEAKELDIVDDINYSFAQIENALSQNYGITVERALEINDMNDYDYMKTIESYTNTGNEEE